MYDGGKVRCILKERKRVFWLDIYYVACALSTQAV